MSFTEWFPGFYKETFALQVLSTQRTIKALAMVVIIDGLYPAVSSLDGKGT